VAVHHVSLNVDDVEAALRFYCDVLGLEARSDRPDFPFGGAWLDAGGQQVHLMQSDAAPPGANHFAIRVDDIDPAVADLQDRGVEVHRVPLIAGSGHQAFLHDPFGNMVELNEPE